MNPIIQIRDIDFTFDPGKPSEVHALNHISLEVMPGEYVAFFGPSGCGKTTLLYAIAGIQRPQAGDIIVDGQKISGLSQTELAVFRQTKIGIIFQSFNLLPTLTVLDNVALPMAFLGIEESERRKRASELLNRVGLGYLADRYPTELSGGQQQRVSIARSIANDPSIILADEPMGNLDSTNAKIVLDQLNELRATYGKTIVMVTHEVWTLRDVTKIFFMRDGSIISTQDRVPGEMSEQAAEDIEIIKQHVATSSLSKDESKTKESSSNKREIEKESDAVQDVAPTPPPPPQEPEKKIIEEIHPPETTALLRTLYPERTKDEIRIHALSLLLMHSYQEVARKRFELALGQRRFGALTREEFTIALDLPIKEGGIGLWKQTAERLSNACEEYISQWEFIDGVIAQLEKNPHAHIELEIEVLTRALSSHLPHILKLDDYARFEEIVEESVRGIISSEHFEKILSLPKSSLGLGFRGNTPHAITEQLRTMLAGATVSSASNQLPTTVS